MIPETSEPTQQRISTPDHDEEERMAMEFYIACAPEDHPVIPGAGGFRKVRQARPGKGKSGGFRAVYFFLGEPGRIFMAAIYAKSRKETLSAADRNVLPKLACPTSTTFPGQRQLFFPPELIFRSPSVRQEAGGHSPTAIIQAQNKQLERRTMLL